MKGFPKTLSSKEDYIYIKDNFPAEQWKLHWQALLGGRFDWFNVGAVDPPGVVDDTHKVEVSQEEGQEPVYYQYEWRENPDAKIFRIGFTVAEVEAALE